MYSSMPECPINRYLHSFPTRRSSDLDATSKHTPTPVHRSEHLATADRIEKHFRQGRLISIVAAFVSIGLSRKCSLRRSEEHTSELQSQSNLVCRLLPEKKKHTTTGIF